ncbi:MAG: hypothetical protein JW997_06605, partial [Actinobacteria bacterium]|nr:hypothetical protein [Actinomycetota bacterium]
AKLIVGGFENIENLVHGQFDFITCLGNTLTLLGSRRNVKTALKITRNKLIKGGLALFQFLNFEPEMIRKERYYRPKVFTKDEYNYVTLKHFEYGNLQTLADFIKIQMDLRGNVTDFDYSTSYMCTLRQKMFLKMALNAGFKKIELLSPDGGEAFDKKRHISLTAVMHN